MIDWTLRYKSPLADSKGVEDVTLTTHTDNEPKAREVAEDWLGRFRSNPNTKFISLKRACVWTEDQMYAARAADLKAKELATGPDAPTSRGLEPGDDLSGSVPGAGNTVIRDPNLPPLPAYSDAMTAAGSAKKARIGQ